jgi:hypothetical protein
MTWIENILKWRALTPEQKQQLRWESIPSDVVQSMAFEREPVSEMMVRETLARIEPPAISKRRTAS